MKANRTITRENAMRVLYQIFLYKKNKIDYTTNGVIEEYMDNIPLEERKIINTEFLKELVYCAEKCIKKARAHTLVCNRVFNAL